MTKSVTLSHKYIGVTPPHDVFTTRSNLYFLSLMWAEQLFNAHADIQNWITKQVPESISQKRAIA